MKRFLLLAFLFSAAVCSAGLRPGNWTGYFMLQDTVRMPFRFTVQDSEVVFKSGNEKIRATYIVHDETVEVNMPVFDASFYWKVQGDTLAGTFINRMRKSNRDIRCYAVYGEENHAVQSFELADFSGRWASVFAGDDPPLNLSVAEFAQKGNYLTGTFLTSTGDFRFLEGYADGRSFELSAFDGSHVFYFTATLNGDTLRGDYYSGTHWHDTWIAWRNERAALPNPDSLAFLKPGFSTLSFSFPDENGQKISSTDKRFQGKVVLVQLMGSWCPNCMDETAVLAPLFDRYNSRGLEIVGLDFERLDSFPAAAAFIKKFRKHMSVSYPILFAGSSDHKKRAETMPELTDVVALPTLIFMDRKGRVRKIHTGFSGPATGAHYEAWKEETTRFIEHLLHE